MLKVLGLEGLAPSEIVFVSGAGISRNAPTNGPLGAQLLRRAFQRCFPAEGVQLLMETYAALGVADPARPRLEAVLGVVEDVYGEEAVRDLLDDLRDPEPNSLHCFFARHLNAGGAHVTANFDTAIEKASRSMGADVQVIHFHGSLAATPQAIGATLRRIEMGFDDDMRRRLREALLGEGVAAIVFVGYSGSDYFDMDPLLRQLALSRQVPPRVIWLRHGNPVEVVVGGEADRVRQLSWFHAAGAETVLVQRPTVSTLDELAQSWGFPRVIDDPPQADHDSIASADTPASSRWLAMYQLFAHIGLFAQLREIVERSDSSLELDPGMNAELAWQEGRYRDALRWYLIAFGGASAEMRCRRWERRAACQWVRGSLFSAYSSASRALRIAEQDGLLETHPAVAVRAFEMQARVLVHMGRSPDVAWFASKRRRARLGRRIQLTVAAAGSIDTHTRIRIESALGDLVGEPRGLMSDGRTGTETGTEEISPEQSSPDDETATFEQFESMSAALDYARGAYRRKIAGGRIQPSADWFKDIERRYRLIGKAAAANTLVMVPGAESAYSFREAARAIARVDFTGWHRVRILADFAWRTIRVRAPHPTEGP